MAEYRAPGKIMLTGEYAVLQGATALAFPTKLGQRMQVQQSIDGLRWTSSDPNGEWFSARWDRKGQFLESTDRDVANRLIRLLLTAKELNNTFQPFAFDVVCSLEFPTNWGLGSSSTLIALVAEWADVDAMELFRKSWKGSGYDVAVALENAPIAFRINQNNNAEWHPISFCPPTPSEWYFVHQNKKQSTYSEIERVKHKHLDVKTHQMLDDINKVVLSRPSCSELIEALSKHEAIMSDFIGKPRMKTQLNTSLFIKSLGAWGGDFLLVHSKNKETVNQLGFNQIFSWENFIA